MVREKKVGVLMSLGMILLGVRCMGESSWLLVDATDVSSGATASLEAVMDVNVQLAGLESDVVLTGRLVVASGKSLSLRETIDRNFLRNASLVAVPGKPNTYNVVAGGVALPKEGPWEIIYKERMLPGTKISRITGQIFDPKNNRRVNFTGSSDPLPVVVVIAGAAVVICGAVVLMEAVLDDCVKRGQNECGKRGLKTVIVERTFGFSWKRGEFGCGQECKIECNQDSGH
jgi:hypothetical protein